MTSEKTTIDGELVKIYTNRTLVPFYDHRVCVRVNPRGSERYGEDHKFTTRCSTEKLTSTTTRLVNRAKRAIIEDHNQEARQSSAVKDGLKKALEQE